MGFDFSGISELWRIILNGLLLTIFASLSGIALGGLIGALLAVGRLVAIRPIAWMARGFVEFMRNLPFMVLLFLIFYLLPATGLRLPAVAIGVITLGLYAGAYFSEIIRGAILSVPKGQTESALAAGMSKGQALRHVVFPQMLGYLLPPATGQAVLVVKESSVLSTITVLDLTMAGQIIQGYTYAPVEVFLVVTVLYWALCSGVSRAGMFLERLVRSNKHARVGRSRHRIVAH